MSNKINIYAFFHLNIAFSSIEEDRYLDLISKSYFPLLDFIESSKVPIGIEVSGYTLEKIYELAPIWIDRFNKLNSKGLIELIGSGYSQLIGPLVPWQVTSANLEIGNKIYGKYFDLKPRVALINEQAFSKGLIEIYLNNGYEAIIMEWNNPRNDNSNWKDQWQFYPQIAMDDHGNQIKIIWNNTIYFQKFQRYVHGDISFSDYKKFIKEVEIEENGFFPIYGSDVEIFNFRPGRFKTESKLLKELEWKRIKKIFEYLKNKKNTKITHLSNVLESNNKIYSNNKLFLTSSKKPIVVKKQPKYNVTRWAVTGRNDFEINTRCWRIFKLLCSKRKDIDLWKKLCFFWSSDFRTHITEKRWNEYIAELNKFEKKIIQKNRSSTHKKNNNKSSKLNYKITKKNILEIEGQRLKVKLNCKKGLAIEGFIDKSVYKEPLFGTLSHGFFDDIDWAFDLYSGHFVYELNDSHKITDLYHEKPDISYEADKLKIEILIVDEWGSIKKNILIDDENGRLSIDSYIDFNQKSPGVIRLGYLTLFNEHFEKDSLGFKTSNGGRKLEQFKIEGDFDHSSAISRLVSSNCLISMTNGFLLIGDKKKKIKISFDHSENAMVGMIQNKKILNKNLTRFFFSIREMDETYKNETNTNKFHISYNIEVQK